jgi:hypothetical protein
MIILRAAFASPISDARFNPMRSLTIVLWACSMLAGNATTAVAAATAADAPPDTASRRVYLDQAGTIRWRDNGQEIGLFGANYCLMSGSDYRMAGLLSRDRKQMIDEDMAQFARMGWTALRLCSWGDWENSDRQGNLVVNEHVDLLDYVVAAARKRGIYILLTPIHTYDPRFADQLGQPSAEVGFSRYYDRAEMGLKPASIRAQANYIGQLLRHVNPYTGVTLKDEPAILFVEVINEPVHHPEDLKGSVTYINTLVKAVRATGSRQLTFFNVSQDFNISEALRRSQVDGVSFGWYPSSLVAGHTLQGNFLPSVDAYPDMLRPELARRPRIVYEFDQADLLTGYMYPAMARTFRSVGAQCATMFAYDSLQTAPFNLGWQTHYLNLVHTPRKAVSAIIAAEAMRRLPSRQDYGRYPASRNFGDFRVSYEDDLSELNAVDAYMNAGPTRTAPRAVDQLNRIVGFGSSPLVGYEGTGAYFLDQLREGVWRLEIYPDELLVRDPFEQPQPGKVVSRLLDRSWPMTVRLPDLGAAFYAQPVRLWQKHEGAQQRAESGRFTAVAGVWLLSAAAQVDTTTLPATVNRVGFDEYHVNEPRSYADDVQNLTPAEFMTGSAVRVRVRVANDALPDSVSLWLRPLGSRDFGAPVSMTRTTGNDYVATLDPDRTGAGVYEYAVTTATAARRTTFPGAAIGQPGSWPFHGDSFWSFRVTPGYAALRLLDPGRDAARLSFVRPGEQFRSAFFRILPAESSDAAALRLELPRLGADTPQRYAASLYIGDAIAARSAVAQAADRLHIRLRAAGGEHSLVTVKLIETDGSSWNVDAKADAHWSEVSVPLGELQAGRSILIPSPYPGLWNYWRPSPVNRGGVGDRVHVEDVEGLELDIEARHGSDACVDASGVDVESIWLSFDGQ